MALDITAKHIPPDKDGVRIAQLDMMTYRRTLWTHRDLTDFWMVGAATAKRLNKLGLYTMGDVARCSVQYEDMLYREFGKNAVYLIDQAWGREPVDIPTIKAYKPESTSTSSGQVLTRPYTFEETRIIIQEMIDKLVLELVEKGVMTDQVVLMVGYDIENLTDPKRRAAYHGEIKTDHYGRQVPKHARGTANMGRHTSSTKLIMTDKFPYEDIVNLPPHISKKHPQPTMLERAARFAPFAAITGYEEMVLEEARVTEERIEMDEGTLAILNEKLNIIHESLDSEPIIKITCSVSVSSVWLLPFAQRRSFLQWNGLV